MKSPKLDLKHKALILERIRPLLIAGGHLKLRDKAMILVIVPVLFSLGFGGFLLKMYEEAEHDAAVERTAKSIIAKAQELSKLSYDATFYVVRYGITNNDSLLNQYDEIMSTLPDKIEELDLKVKEYTPDDHAFEKVKTASYQGLGVLRSFRARAKQGDRNFFDHDVRRVLHKYVLLLSEFIAHEQEISKELLEKAAKSRQVVKILIVMGMLLSIPLGMLLAIFFEIGSTSRLKILMDNTGRLVQHQPLHNPVVGNDEIAHLDQVFHQMADALAEAAQRKQELVSMVSHDLRTPLMSIQVSLELLSDGVMGDLPKSAMDELLVAECSASQLIQLINDLLDIDKMESGRFEIHPRSTELLPILEHACRTLRAFAERNQVTICLPEETPKIFVDADRLFQIIVNLLSNAIKFSNRGGQVHITVDELAAAMRINVFDNGRGIPAGSETKIFERFHQVNPDDPTERRGSGLGLAICKALVEAHHGEMGVVSTEGRGSNFWFTLPKEAADYAIKCK